MSHAARLVLVVVTLYGLTHTGLVGVSMGRSVVGVMMSIAGTVTACLLIGVESAICTIWMVPGVGLALMCAIAVTAGKITASACGTQGVATLLLLVDRPRSFCWRRSSTAMRMLGDASDRGEPRANRRGPGDSMNRRAAARASSPEPELQILPLERARDAWDGWPAGSERSLYHRGPWFRGAPPRLRRAAVGSRCLVTPIPRWPHTVSGFRAAIRLGAV